MKTLNTLGPVYYSVYGISTYRSPFRSGEMFAKVVEHYSKNLKIKQCPVWKTTKPVSQPHGMPALELEVGSRVPPYGEISFWRWRIARRLITILNNTPEEAKQVLVATMEKVVLAKYLKAVRVIIQNVSHRNSETFYTDHVFKDYSYIGAHRKAEEFIQCGGNSGQAKKIVNSENL